MMVARALALPLSDARALLGWLPVALPIALEATDADALVAALEAAGAKLDSAPVDREIPRCAAHGALDAAERCSRCDGATCALCAATSAPRGLCSACGARAGRSRLFFRLRVSVLLVVLAGVLLYAYRDVSRRRARNEWQRTLHVGLVVVRLGAVDDASVAQLRERAHALEATLAAEAARYVGPGRPKPFEIEVYGPVDAASPPPLPEGDGALDLVRYTIAKRRYLARVDAAAGVDDGLDSRIYVAARPGHARGANVVEGASEEGGRTGIVEVDLDATMVDYALFVFAHELFHTLGATDKYDAAGLTMIPDGLAEPDAEPRYPQRYVELMARRRPLAPGKEKSPDTLHDLRVGPSTAREVGWTRRLP
jgi:hypothetical protein